MAVMDKLGAFIQKALFSTTFIDIIEAIDGLKTRIETLDGKVGREVAQLRKELTEAEARLTAAEAAAKKPAAKKPAAKKPAAKKPAAKKAPQKAS